MRYQDEITKAMTMLGEDERTIFIGQSIVYKGHIMFSTLEGVPMLKRLELPVFEDVQMGMSIGLSLGGYIPISIYPRIDFLIIAMNQLINHLDKIEEMSCGHFVPKVIIRTMVGSTKVFNPGAQHKQDHTEALRSIVTNINVWKLEKASSIMPAYEAALKAKNSTILIELGNLYED